MTNFSARELFNRLISEYDTDITVPTATALAKELGLDFRASDFAK